MSELIDNLLRASVWLAIAVLVLAALRPLMLRLGGPLLAYRSWLLVPLLLLAPLLPQPLAPHAAAVPVLTLPPLRSVAEASTGSAFPWQMLLLCWAAGVALCAVRAWRAQRRFEHALGHLQPRADGSWQASADPGLPALVGLWHPRIVVGPAFESQFSADERALVLQHEHNHRRHGDHWANAVLLALRCLLWFHPLLPWAAARFLRDQELACDARTIEPHPALRRTYATALLKAQLVHPVAPMACHLRGHPLLKERIAMIKQSQRKALQRVSGQVLAAGLFTALATVAWASQTSTSSMTTSNSTRISTEASSTAEDGNREVQVSNMLPPRYPRSAMENNQGGVVTVQVDVDAQGNISGVRVVKASNPGVFDAVSLEAARSWTYLPAMKDGKPVAASVRIPLTFEMNETASAP